jgi:hypothetical protein
MVPYWNEGHRVHKEKVTVGKAVDGEPRSRRLRMPADATDEAEDGHSET